MGAALAVMMSTAAHAEKVGVSMALFDDNFLTVLRNGMQDYAKTLDGVTLQVEDAQNDVAKQLSQIQNFIAARSTPSSSTRSTPMRPPPCRRSPPMPAFRWSMSTASRSTSTAAGEAGFRCIQRSRIRHAGDPGNLPAARSGKGKAVCHDGRALQPGRLQRTKDVHDVIATRRVQRASRSSTSRPPTGRAPRAQT